MEAGKLVPAETSVQLIARALQALPPPYLLADFPRMGAHLRLLEAACGEVGCALAYRSAE